MMQRRTMIHSTIWATGGAALLLSGAWLHMRAAGPVVGGDGVRVIAGRQSVGDAQRREHTTAPLLPPPSPPVTEVATGEVRASAKHYGEPVVAADALLDDALATAPDVIGVRRRLFAMQWPDGRDPPAEQAWQARLAPLAGGASERVRVRCSTTTCEVATGDPALAPRLGALVKPEDADRAASCPLVAPDVAVDRWSGGGVAVAYVPRGGC